MEYTPNTYPTTTCPECGSTKIYFADDDTTVRTPTGYRHLDDADADAQCLRCEHLFVS
jgi:predicted nucleic-acid-binding Zn-ribbon protein